MYNCSAIPEVEMQIILDGSVHPCRGVWFTSVPPHQISILGAPKASKGTTSVLLVTEAKFDPEAGKLALNADNITVANLGTSPRTIVVDADAMDEGTKASKGHPGHLGPGDREFLQLVEAELAGEAREMARELLRAIRAQDAGDLKRGGRNNFSNTPDNFWYVIIQPRVQGLSVTVRGSLDRFGSSTIKLNLDRPGYTRFSLRELSELPEALRIIGLAKRR
jgi:hypothetical protein